MIDILLQKLNSHFIGIVWICCCTKTTDAKHQQNEFYHLSYFFLFKKSTSRISVAIDWTFLSNIYGRIWYGRSSSIPAHRRWNSKLNCIASGQAWSQCPTCKVLKPILPWGIEPNGTTVNTNFPFATFDDNSICLSYPNNNDLFVWKIPRNLPNTSWVNIFLIDNCTIRKRQFIRRTFRRYELHGCSWHFI